MQPLVRPELMELLKKRIDVLYLFEVDSEDGGKATLLQWCQGLVLK